jgi:hypothetical protein
LGAVHLDRRRIFPNHFLTEEPMRFKPFDIKREAGSVSAR